jgi:hypothetical protein
MSQAIGPRIYDDSDDLDALTAERVAGDPTLPGLIAAACERRAFLRQMVERRQDLGIPQKQVARTMGISPGVRVEPRNRQGRPSTPD